MADRTYKLKLQLSNGSEIDAGTFAAPQGEKGDTGATGSVSSITTTGTGNAVTAVTLNADKSVTVTKGATYNYYSHPTSAGYKHIPSGGSTNQHLQYIAAGTAKWGGSIENWTFTLANGETVDKKVVLG